MADYIRVGAVAEVPDGELRSYELPPGRVAVAHIENELFALGDECTHEGCLLSEGELDDRGRHRGVSVPRERLRPSDR